MGSELSHRVSTVDEAETAKRGFGSSNQQVIRNQEETGKSAENHVVSSQGPLESSSISKCSEHISFSLLCDFN